MIVLSVLKIIGIVVACIIGFVLFIILTACLAPVTYRIDALGENKDIEVNGKARWIFGLFAIDASFKQKKFELIGKIFNKKLFGDDKNISENSSGNIVISDDTAYLTDKEDSKNTDNVNSEKRKIKPEKNIKKDKTEKRKKEKDKNKEKKKIPISEKTNNIKIKIEKIKKLVNAKTSKRAVKYAKGLLFKLLNHIKPDSVKGFVNFGLGEPDKTALIYGTVAPFLSMIDKNFVIIPELEEKSVNMDVVIKGRLFIGFVLILVVKFFINKDIARVRKYISKI